MSAKEWVEKYGRLGLQIRDKRVLFYATTATMDDMEKRIWGRGELSGGGKLQYNNGPEMYIYKPPFPQAPNGKGKYGAKIKGQWAPSYIAAKATQGRGDLPFELTGDLRKAWLGGVSPEPRELDPLLCVIDLPPVEFKKAEGLAKQKGPFLLLTSEERRKHPQYVNLAYRERVLGQAA